MVLCCVPGSQANFVSRRRAINERLMAQNLDQSKVWRIGVKNMPPMCFYDATLPDNERFSGVRFNNLVFLGFCNPSVLLTHVTPLI